MCKRYLLTIIFITLCADSFSQNFKHQKKKIKANLEKAYDLDQKVRQEYNSCVASFGIRSDNCKKLRLALSIQDSINQKIVSNILDQYGWLSRKKISKKGNKALFYVIQHAPLLFQSKYADLIDTGFKTGDINPTEYAFFVDRFRTKQGLAELYGTQTETDNLGNSYLYPIKNWDQVNSLRADLELPFLNFSEIPEYNWYPKKIENDSIVLIGHIFDKTSTPIKGAVVMIESIILGKSNEKGFFVINLKRPKEGTKITVAVSNKQNSTIIKNLKDFYSIYMQF